MKIKKSEKTKKGFTLFELLATIVIISLIVVIGVPVYQASTKRTKQKMFDIKMDTANQSGKLWAQDNIDCFKSGTCEDKISPVPCDDVGSSADGTCYFISLGTLAKEGYYNYDDDNENIINPTDNSLMNDNQVILVYNDKSNKVSNHPAKTYRYKVITFDNLVQQTQNHVVTIDNLSDIDFVKSDTGTVTYSKSNNNVTLTFNNGVPTSSEWNPTLYSIAASAYRTSSSDSFSNTYNYNSDGYEGVLSKNGNSTVISGSYVADDTKYVTNQSKRDYNSGGYTGTLSLYHHSGGYHPADSFYHCVTYYDGYNHKYMEYTSSGWKQTGSNKSSMPKSFSYSVGSYSGYLYRVDDWIDSSSPHWTTVYPNPRVGQTYTFTDYWAYESCGTLTRPAYDDTVYRYAGYVTKEGYDTRVWQQNYSGTAYKGGEDNLYSYTATIAYNVKKK